MAGNKAGLYTTFTFRDTGIAVQIRKVSPMMATEIARQNPDPEPPEQEVDYGEPRGIVKEKNYSDPAYLKLVAEHKQKLFELLQRTMILRAVQPIDADWKEGVTEYRAFMKDHGAEIEEPDDLVVYVMHLCIGTQEDMEEMLAAITRRSQPTPEEVELAKVSFRS